MKKDKWEQPNPVVAARIEMRHLVRAQRILKGMGLNVSTISDIPRMCVSIVLKGMGIAGDLDAPITAVELEVAKAYFGATHNRAALHAYMEGLPEEALAQLGQISHMDGQLMNKDDMVDEFAQQAKQLMAEGRTQRQVQRDIPSHIELPEDGPVLVDDVEEIDTSDQLDLGALIGGGNDD